MKIILKTIIIFICNAGICCSKKDNSTEKPKPSPFPNRENLELKMNGELKALWIWENLKGKKGSKEIFTFVFNFCDDEIFFSEKYDDGEEKKSQLIWRYHDRSKSYDPKNPNDVQELMTFDKIDKSLEHTPVLRFYRVADNTIAVDPGGEKLQLLRLKRQECPKSPQK